MAKQSGLGDNLYVAEFNLSGDVGSLGTIQGGNSALDVTSIDKSAHERLGGLRDGSMEFTSFFNDAAGQEHDALSTLPRTDRVVSYFRGTTLGGQAASMVAKQINYDVTRDDSGALTLEVSVQANGFGLEWGRMFTAGRRTDASATNGDSVDAGAASSFGLQAYLHVFSLDSGTATVKLQQSSDDGSGDAFADVTGGAFTAVTGVTSERIATADDLAVERYLRVVTTGTFSNLVFAVNVVRNDVAVVF